MTFLATASIASAGAEVGGTLLVEANVLEGTKVPMEKATKVDGAIQQSLVIVLALDTVPGTG